MDMSFKFGLRAGMAALLAAAFGASPLLRHRRPCLSWIFSNILVRFRCIPYLSWILSNLQHRMKGFFRSSPQFHWKNPI
ncbi:MAG: hypothetical protein C6P35_07835 [Cohnella sp.]|uniref:hypothetical protein n=1 Tax=Cohnella sp. TaxID=1883426 RepID=UPI000E382E31|nr:hypothetical protein [Cohnella sp.]REK66567.1 MAG: hypothetical protein C6P35_07835 [Cohnella sp.]